MMTALPPPRSRPAHAALYAIALDRLRTSESASSSLAYGYKRFPPRAGPRAVEYTAMIARRPVSGSCQKLTCSWPVPRSNTVTQVLPTASSVRVVVERAYVVGAGAFG